MKLPNKIVGVPGGWRYRQPETGAAIEAPHWTDLVRAVKAHRVANNLPVGLLFEQEIEQQLCERTPEYCNESGIEGPAVFGFGLTFETILRGTSTLASWFLQGRPKVDQAEADQHAAICTTCPQNQPAEGCSPCNWKRLQQVIETVTGAGRTANDAALQTCRLCGCSLKAKVWFQPTFLREHMSAAQVEALPPHCWIKPQAL